MTDAAKDLARRLAHDGPDLHAIADLLDGLPEIERIDAVRALGASAQKRLWHAAEGLRRLRLTDIVPAATPDMTAVVHCGRNSLPAFTIFEKRFYRARDVDPAAPAALCGANFQTMSPFTGPGYFVAGEDESRGEILIDYHRVPSAAPPGWPAIVGNDRGFSRFVYDSLTDVLRGVSQHVTIGVPARRGRPLGSYFVLCRKGPS